MRAILEEKKNKKAKVGVTKKRKLNFGPREKKGTKKGEKWSFCNDDEYNDDLEENIDDPKNRCLICEEFGRDQELWYRCVSCGYWAHADCSGWESPDDYICDLCILKEKKKNKKK
uniref:Zinc finger PHD-type domain-containing protein n=1 Tax=Cacopsylla melanoneura TaxID=428564 RepID=A0A8D9EI83_9HEMI